MKREKYLFYFRFQFPVDWLDTKQNEAEKFVFIYEKSEKNALRWGNVIAENFIEKLSSRNNYSNNIGFMSFIWEKFSDLNNTEIKESRTFPVVKVGEFPDWSF